MGWFKSVPGVVAGLAMAGVLAVVGWVGVRTWSAAHPSPRDRAVGEVALSLVAVEEVQFRSADGLTLRGWLFEGSPNRPPIVLCHGLRDGQAGVLDLAVALQKEGFTVLTFDFRGSGRSDGRGVGFGVAERADVLGAVDFLATRNLGAAPPRIGVYGVGTGAHAAVLAARDRPAMSVLVLDGLVPDGSWPLVREVFGAWKFGCERLAFLPKWIYAAFAHTDLDDRRAADVLPVLSGRRVLLLAPAASPELAGVARQMYDSVPEGASAERNLLVVPRTGEGTWRGEDARRVHDRIATFFRERLSTS